MSYKHLNPEERHYIEVQHKNGVSANEISKALNRSQPTISRELLRNTGGRDYRYKTSKQASARTTPGKRKSG